MEKPIRACVLLLKVEGDTPSNVAGALESIAAQIDRGEVMGPQVSGGYGSGWILHYQQNDGPTHDEYFQQLNAHLEEQRAKGE